MNNGKENRPSIVNCVAFDKRRMNDSAYIYIHANGSSIVAINKGEMVI